MKYFRFHDEELGQSHYLELLGPDELLEKCTADELIDKLFDSVLLPEMEQRNLEGKYGVHDVSFSTGTKTLWGFSTYEVEKSKWGSLMQEWREIFTMAGFTVGGYFVKDEQQDEQL